MQYTTNLFLRKPQLTDEILIGDFNENADRIDYAIKRLQDMVYPKEYQSGVIINTHDDSETSFPVIYDLNTRLFSTIPNVQELLEIKGTNDNVISYKYDSYAHTIEFSALNPGACLIIYKDTNDVIKAEPVAVCYGGKSTVLDRSNYTDLRIRKVYVLKYDEVQLNAGFYYLSGSSISGYYKAFWGDPSVFNITRVGSSATYADKVRAYASATYPQGNIGLVVWNASNQYNYADVIIAGDAGAYTSTSNSAIDIASISA